MVRCVALSSVFVLLLVSLPAGATPTFPAPSASTPDTIFQDLNLHDVVMNVVDKHLVVKGEIHLSGTAQLNVRQSIITIDKISKRHIKLQDMAVLRADTTIFGETLGVDPANAEGVVGVDFEVTGNAQVHFDQCFALVMSFAGNSYGEIRNSTILLEPLGVVHVEGASNTYFENSRIGAVFLDVTGMPAVTIDGLVPGYFSFWSLQNDVSSLFPYELVLNDTTVNENVKGYEGGMELGWNVSVGSGDTLTIANSRLNKLAINFSPTEHAFAADLERRVPVDFHHNDIHLINTEVQTQWLLNTVGGGGTVLDSDGVWLFMMGGAGNVHVANSLINELDPWNHNGSMTLDNATWCCGYEIFDGSDFYVEGTVRMLKTVPLIDPTSTMTRLYDLRIVLDSDGTQLAGLPLELRKSGSVVWAGTTDAQGETSLDITFDGTNFQDEWRLQCPDPVVNLDRALSIGISNPVVVALEMEEDGIHYRPVMHVAAATPGIPDGTRQRPYDSIEEAIDNSGGGVIRVGPGHYRGYTVPGESKTQLTLRDDVILIGAGPDHTVIEDVVFAEQVDGAELRGFTLRDGVELLESSAALYNNVITDATRNGVLAINSSLTLVNNTIVGNDSSAVYLVQGSTAEIRNNIIASNSRIGIHGLGGCAATIDYNDVYGNTLGDYAGCTAGAHDLASDPSFVDPLTRDYHLAPGSPCIDAGDPAPSYTDPDGSRSDMGAYGGPGAESVVVAVEEGLGPRRSSAILFPCYPNPFNGRTRIDFQLSGPGWVTIDIYDVAGRRVRTLIDGERRSGRQSVVWDGLDRHGRGVSSGVYWYRLRSGDFDACGRAVYVR